MPTDNGARLLTDSEKAELLALLKKNKKWTLRQAAEKVGARRRDAKKTLTSDAEFGEAYRETRGYDNDQIRQQIRKRAFALQNPSDRLLLAMAKAYLPEYQERTQLAITHEQAPPIDWSLLSDEEVAVVRAAIAKGMQGLPEDERPALELVAPAEPEVIEGEAVEVKPETKPRQRASKRRSA